MLEALGARIDLGPERGRALHRPRGLRLHVRARPPQRDALRRARAQGARRPHDLQLPRPADEPRRRAPPAHRRLGPRVSRADGGRARAAGVRPGVASVQRGWPGRDEHVCAHPRRRGERRRDPALRRGPPTSGSRSPRSTPCAAARPTTTPRRPARSSPATTARRATSPPSTPAPRSTRGGIADSLAEGVEAARAAIDSGAAERTLDDYVALSRELRAWRARPSSLSDRCERPRPHRRRHPRRRGAAAARRCRWPSSRAARRAARRPPVPRGAHAPRRVAHRRAQAPLAQRRRDPLGRDRRRRRDRLRARRRGRAVDPHRGPALRRLAGRSARGARARPTCRSCARTSSSTPTRCTSPRSPAPTRSC